MNIIQNDKFSRCVRIKSGTLEALIAPEQGMSVIDLTVNGIPVLDRYRMELYLSCRKGFVPIIFPQFNQEGFLPQVNEKEFFQTEGLAKLNIRHPFQHGVGRYVPWAFKGTDTSVTGRISSSDILNGYKLEELAGCRFYGELTYAISKEEFCITFNAESNNPVQAGIHFYFDLINRKTAEIKLPSGQARDMTDFGKSWDKAFAVTPDKNGECCALLKTEKYKLETRFTGGMSRECDFDEIILHSPKDCAFACIEPVTWISGIGKPRKSVHASIQLAPSAIL